MTEVPAENICPHCGHDKTDPDPGPPAFSPFECPQCGHRRNSMNLVGKRRALEG